MTKHIHGGDVYKYRDCLDFSANCNPLGTPESVKQAIRDSLDHICDYPQVGCAPLKAAIAKYENIDPESVICGNGAADLIFSLCRAVNPQTALLLAPTFAEYEQALRSVECEIRRFYLKETENFALEESYLEALKERPEIIFLCNPNNPTGITIRQEFLEKILERCTELGIFMVVDECFLDFVKEPQVHTLKEKLKTHQNLFLLKAFTKRYAMPGVRLGYALCSDKNILEKMEQVTQPWNVSTMAQEAGLAALKETAYVENGRELVFGEADWMKEQMKALGLKVYPSEANYIFFQGPEDLFEQCVKKGVLIRDCGNYPGLSRGYFRVAVKTHEKNQQLIRVLKEVKEA